MHQNLADLLQVDVPGTNDIIAVGRLSEHTWVLQQSTLDRYMQKLYDNCALTTQINIMPCENEYEEKFDYAALKRLRSTIGERGSDRGGAQRLEERFLERHPFSPLAVV